MLQSSTRVYVLVLAAALLLFAALTSLLQKAQSCGCEQTYMYTSYTEVPVLDPVWSNHRYRLMLYREMANPRQALPPSGHAALLIPGNAGSYEQVRSLASQTARLTARARQAADSSSSSSAVPEIDWYALDLRGELSAFDGQLLQDQMQFALVCLQQLAAMYSSSSSSMNMSHLPPMLQPERKETFSRLSSSSSRGGGADGLGLLLVGHSMGGVIARATAAAAWSDPVLGPGSISLLLTLASPHMGSPLMLQPALARFYSGPLSAPLPPQLPVVSLHGGAADMQVSPLLTWIPPARRHQPDLNSSSNSGASPAATAAVPGISGSLHVTQPTLMVPGVWCHAGHTQIDWCNQLVTRLSAALLEVTAQQQQQQEQEHAGHRRKLLRSTGGSKQDSFAAAPAVVPDHDAATSHSAAAAGPTDAAAAAGAATGAGERYAARAAVTAEVMLQYLTSDAVSVLSSGDHPISQQQQQQQLGTVGQEVSKYNSSTGLQPQHQQQQGEEAVHLRQSRQHRHGRQRATHRRPVSHPMQQEQQQRNGFLPLLLPSITPYDIMLTRQEYSCSPSGPDQDQGVSHRPDWYINSQGAVKVALPDSKQQQAYYKARPSAGAAAASFAAAEAGDDSSTSSTAAEQKLGGAVYMWDVAAATAAAGSPTSEAAAAADFVLLASGVKPCLGFRVWVGRQTTASPAAAAAVAAAAAAGGGNGLQWTDVTASVVPLPTVQDELVLPVRNPDLWEDVMAGRDYFVPASWALTLTPHTLEPPGHTSDTLENSPDTHVVTQVAVWLAPNSSSSSQHQNSAVPAAATVTMQWLARATGSQVQPQQQQQQQQWPEVSLSLLQLLQPLQRPAGGPMLLQVNLKQQFLLQQALSLKVVNTQQPHLHSTPGSGSSSSSGAVCWQPVAMYSSIWGGQEHSLVLNTTLSSVDAAKGWVGWVKGVFTPWFAAGTKVSKHKGSMAGAYAQLQLAEVSRSSSSSTSVLLLLDPDCSYELHLGLDFVGAGSRLLLGHASAAAGIAVALLLLVLSHQMSSLVRVMSVARHGTAVPLRAPITTAAAAAAAAGGQGDHASRSSSPGQQPQQQHKQYSQRQQLSSTSSSRRRSPSPAAAAGEGGGVHHGEGGDSGGGGYIPSLPSPAGVARRLVRTASSDITDEVADVTLLDSYSDSDSEHKGIPLLGRQQQQPSVAAAGVASHRTIVGHTSGAEADAEWGLGQGNLQQNPKTAQLSAMQRFRRQMTLTLGGAPPPVEQQLAVAGRGRKGRSSSVRVRSDSTHSTLDHRQQQQQQQEQVNQTGFGLGLLRKAGSLWPFNSSSSRNSVPASRHSRSQPGMTISSWRAAGISVLGSLVAVTGDLRVLLVAAVLSAAAGSMNSINPDSIWYSSSSSIGTPHPSVPPPAPAASAAATIASQGVHDMLQRLLGLFGLVQRGDSPGVIGAAVLMGIALLVLLVAVAVSLGLKWCLDYVTAAVAACNRSLTPDASTLAAIARASQGGGAADHQQQQQQEHGGSSMLFVLPCSCALCTAAAAACGGAAAAVSTGGFCGLGSSNSGNCLEGFETSGAYELSTAVAGEGGSAVGGSSSSSKPREAAALNSGGRATPDVAPPSPAQMSSTDMALKLLSSSSNSNAHSAPMQQFQPAPSIPSATAAAPAAGAARMRSGSSFTDLRQLLQSMRRGASPSPVWHSHAADAAAAAGRGGGSMGSVGSGTTATAAGGGGAGGGGGSSGPWWAQRRSQAQVAVLLLLATANLALGVGGGVLLLFLTWHLPSNSIAAGARAAQLLLGSRSNSRVASRASSPSHLPLPHTTAAAGSDGGSSAHANVADLSSKQGQGSQLLAHGAAQQQQQPQQQREVRVRSEAGLLSDTGDSDGEIEETASELEGLLQPLAKLGTISSLLQQENARREAEAAAAALATAAAAGNQGAGVQDSFSSMNQGPRGLPQQQQQQRVSGVGIPGKARPPAVLLPQQGLPPLPPTPPRLQQQPQQQQQQRMVQVASRVDSTGARALALHQLTCHMCHVWLLLYCCCFWMLLPSLLAWLKLPLGQQHLSHPLDVLTLLPVLLHCVAISSGKVDALVGFGPATAAANWRSSWAAGSSGGSSGAAASYAGSSGGVALGARPLDLHKLAVRAAAGYMFAAAVLGQAVRWIVVVAFVAMLMLAGKQAVEGWYRLHGWLLAGRTAGLRPQKQKGK